MPAMGGPNTNLTDVDLALITDTVRTETATAQEPSIVIRIPRSLFLKMLEGYPEAARSLRDAMAERIDAWTNDLEGVRSKLEAGLKGS